MNAITSIKPDRTARPAPRAVPDDFEVVFVEQGRLECEAWYRASRITVTRWLGECGKKRLIAKRAAYVKHLRGEGKWLTRASNLVEHREMPKPRTQPEPSDKRKIPHELAVKAAHFMRCIRNGGWVVWHIGDGIWVAGTRRFTGAELVDRAAQRGFDVEAVSRQILAEGE